MLEFMAVVTRVRIGTETASHASCKPILRHREENDQEEYQILRGRGAQRGPAWIDTPKKREYLRTESAPTELPAGNDP